MVSFNRILVNMLQTWYNIINLLEELASCISLQNENGSFEQYSLRITESSISVKNFASLKLYVPLEETIERNFNIPVGDFNLFVLVVPYILAAWERQG